MRSTVFYILALFFCLAISPSVFSQTTEFTYQGRLQTGAIAATGNYDFEFSLFDANAVGTQLGSTIGLGAVNVSNGIFSVRLDFGPTFPGADRFLEIRIRQTGGGSFETLAPRQRITSSPYSIKSLESQTADTAVNFSGILSGDVTGSQSLTTINTIGGQTAVDVGLATQSVNAAASANTPDSLIRRDSSGGFSAGSINAASYRLNGVVVININGTENTFVGEASGQANTTGANNSFFGAASGLSNTTAGNNSFFGSQTGRANTTGGQNSFFGAAAGNGNTSGNGNSFFGQLAGLNNTSASNNSFFGVVSGFSNTTGNVNSFFGSGSGTLNTTGSRNAYFGQDAGALNETGNDNAHFGRNAGRNSKASGNSFFGSDAGLGNTTGGLNAFFGSGTGQNNTIGSVNVFVGSDAGFSNSTGNSNAFLGRLAGFGNQTGSDNSFVGRSAGFSNTTGGSNTLIGSGANVGTGNLNFATALGAGSRVNSSNTVVIGRDIDTVIVPNFLQIDNLGAAGSTSLCRNSNNQISTCTAGNISDKTVGLELRIEAQAKEIETLKAEILANRKIQADLDALKKFICEGNPTVEVCKQ